MIGGPLSRAPDTPSPFTHFRPPAGARQSRRDSAPAPCQPPTAMSAAAATSSGTPSPPPASGPGGEGGEITYVSYGGEQHLPLVMSLVDAELSEPYSIFTYRYFVYLWPQLTFLVRARSLSSAPRAQIAWWRASLRRILMRLYWFFLFLWGRFGDGVDCAGVRCKGGKMRGDGGVQDGGAPGRLQGLHRHARRPQALSRKGNR